MARSDLSLEAQIWKLWEIHFFGHLIILLTDHILLHSPNFGRPKQGQKFVVPTFHINFLNPECVRMPWVLASKIFSHWKVERVHGRMRCIKTSLCPQNGAKPQTMPGVWPLAISSPDWRYRYIQHAAHIISLLLFAKTINDEWAIKLSTMKG